jgi:hypothetical protein
MLQGNKRMAMASPARGTPPAATRVFPFGRVVFGLAVCLAALLGLSLRMASTGLLVASAQHDGGRVVACRYFTGTRVAERQHAAVASGADRHVSCPLIRMR